MEQGSVVTPVAASNFTQFYIKCHVCANTCSSHSHNVWPTHLHIVSPVEWMCHILRETNTEQKNHLRDYFDGNGNGKCGFI